MAAPPAYLADDAATGSTWASLPIGSPRAYVAAGICRLRLSAWAPTALASTAGIRSVPATWANGRRVTGHKDGQWPRSPVQPGRLAAALAPTSCEAQICAFPQKLCISANMQR